MRRKQSFTILSSFMTCALAAGVSACESGGGSQAPDGGGVAEKSCESGPFFPLTVGNKWTYRVVQVGVAPSTKTQTVTAMEPIPVDGPHKGKIAYRLETRKGADDKTVSWVTS